MNRLYADLAALRMRLALAKLALKAGFNRDQQRVPVGQYGGGRWADNGAGESGVATDAQLGSQKLTQGSHVVLPNGKMVANPYSNTGYLAAPVPDLSPVADAGRQAGALYQQMLNSPDTDIQQGALPQFVSSIDAAVGQTGTFDCQRSGNRLTGLIQFPEFRDVSNFNGGLYMQQTGQFSEDDTLSLAGTFARYFSSNYMHLRSDFLCQLC